MHGVQGYPLQDVTLAQGNAQTNNEYGFLFGLQERNTALNSAATPPRDDDTSNSDGLSYAPPLSGMDITPRDSSNIVAGRSVEFLWIHS